MHAATSTDKTTVNVNKDNTIKCFRCRPKNGLHNFYVKEDDFKFNRVTPEM